MLKKTARHRNREKKKNRKVKITSKIYKPCERIIYLVFKPFFMIFNLINIQG